MEQSFVRGVEDIRTRAEQTDINIFTHTVSATAVMGAVKSGKRFEWRVSSGGYRAE